MNKKDANNVYKGDVVKIKRTGKIEEVIDRTEDNGNIVFLLDDLQPYTHRELEFVSEEKIMFDSVHAYNLTRKRWELDSKSYLKNGEWLLFCSNTKIGDLSDNSKSEILKIVENHPDVEFNLADLS